MMTGDMDRLLPAPDLSSRSPHGTAGRAPRRPSAQPVRRIAAGVLVGALTMFGVATLDTFAGATVPVLASIAALPGPTAIRSSSRSRRRPPPRAPA